MTIYAEKITDNKKLVGITKSAKLASEMGFKYSFEEMEVEQAYDGSWYLQGYAPEKSQEVKEQEVRAVRNKYLSDYVDPFQLVIRWGTLTEEGQQDLVNYRQYLLDYTKSENWWEQNPLTSDEWKQVVIESSDEGGD